MLATEYLLVDTSLIKSARSDVSQLNEYKRALEPACCAFAEPAKQGRQVPKLGYVCSAGTRHCERS